MKFKRISTLTIALLGLIIIASTAPVSAFTFSAENFSGLVAYDKGGDVISQYADLGVDPRFGYDYTGQTYNFTTSMVFDFTYNPTYPSIEDIALNPNTQWHWTAKIKNLQLPCDGQPLPELRWETVASFQDIKYGTQMVGDMFSEYLPSDIVYSFDYEINDPYAGTGSAYMAMAGNFGALYAAENIPDAMIMPFTSGMQVELCAEPVPEPMTLMLFGAGMAGMGLVRRKMKK